MLKMRGWAVVRLAWLLGVATAAGAHGMAHDPHVVMPSASLGSAEAQAVRHVLMATWHRPEAPLTVEPVVIQGQFAVAGWFQDKRGGRVLLKKGLPGEPWQALICAGDGLRDAELLQGAGMGALQAQALSQAVREAEAGLSAAQRAQLASFAGVLHLEPGQAHGPAGHGGHGGHGQHKH